MTAYVRPSYTELKTRIEVDLAAMPASLRGPLTTAWAKGNHSSHAFLDWIHAQCSPLSCELERLYDWAGLYGVPRLLATASIGVVLGTGVAGTTILKDAELRAQNGLDYVVQTTVDLGGGQTAVQLRCSTPGAAGNLTAGQTLTLINPIPGASSSMTVDENGITGGAEDELVDDWRIRVVDEWQTVTTQGARSGRPEDYRFWAKSAHPSVTGALIQLHTLGEGTVLVRPICNGLPDRLPTPAVLDAVAAYLPDAAPATADWILAAPIKRAVDVSLHLFPVADTGGNRTAINAALAAGVLAEDSEDSVLALAEIDAATATVTSQYTRAAPVADIAVAPGEVLVLNSVTFT